MASPGWEPELLPIPLRGTAQLGSAEGMVLPPLRCREVWAGWWSEPVGRGEGTQIEGSSMQAGCYLSGLGPIGGDMGSLASRDSGPTPLASASLILSPQGLTPGYHRAAGTLSLLVRDPRLTGPACRTDGRGQGPWVGGPSAGTRRSQLWSSPAGGELPLGGTLGCRLPTAPSLVCVGTPVGTVVSEPLGA